MVMKTILKALIFSVTLLALASAAPTADGFVLGVFGNANEDETIDARDVLYADRIVSGLSPQTKLADANRDGKIDALDIARIKLIVAGREKELSLIDSAGKPVTLKMPVNRIVSISTYCSESIRMLGEESKIVAVTSTLKNKPGYFPLLGKLPSVGGYPPNLEAIVSFKPDLLLGATSWTKHLYGIAPEDLVPIVGLDFTSPEFFVEEMVKLGFILNKRDQVDNFLNSFYHRNIAMIGSRTARIPEKNRPRVYVEYAMGNYRAYGGARNFFELVGGINIFADLPAHIAVTPEAVIGGNPDIIIKQWRDKAGYEGNDLSVMREKREEILNCREFSRVTASKEEKVYLLFERTFFGCHYPIGAAYMAKLLHPELFEDIDPRDIHQDFINRFCNGLNFNVHERGIFIYPQFK